MKYLALSFISILIPFNTMANIEDREFLNEIFDGCVANEVDILDAGESFEYCGCVVNTISKEMDMRELLEMSLEILEESDNMTEDKVERLAIQKLIQNEAITDGMISCLVKVYD